MKTKIAFPPFSLTIRQVLNLMFLFGLMVLPFSAFAQTVLNYHVSPGGKDSDDGTFAKPLKQLPKL